jgi:hypothetical protein
MRALYEWTAQTSAGAIRVEYAPMGGKWFFAGGRLFIDGRLADERTGWLNSVRLEDTGSGVRVQLSRASGASVGCRTPGKLIQLSVGGSEHPVTLVAAPWLSVQSRMIRASLLLLMLFVAGNISAILERRYPWADNIVFGSLEMYVLVFVPFQLLARYKSSKSI